MQGRLLATKGLGALHAVAMTLWIGLLVAAGVAAAGAFATLPDLGISLRGYESYATADPADHGRLAAGKMLERIFTAIDFAQIPLAAIAIASLPLQLFLAGDSWQRPANVVRLSCITVACGLLAIHILFIAPPMNRELQTYWAAAAAGDATAAMTHRDAFDEYHPRAEMILQVNLLLLFIAAGAAGVSRIVLVPPHRLDQLEEPLLARRHS